MLDSPRFLSIICYTDILLAEDVKQLMPICRNIVFKSVDKFCWSVSLTYRQQFCLLNRFCVYISLLEPFKSQTDHSALVNFLIIESEYASNLQFYQFPLLSLRKFISLTSGLMYLFPRLRRFNFLEVRRC